MDNELERWQAVASNVKLLVNIAKATLLFHSPSPWDEKKAKKWKEITGQTECNTAVLCNFIRATIAEVEKTNEH